MVNSDFELAVQGNAVPLVREFLRNGEPPDDYVCFLAIRLNANAVLRLLVDAGADLNARDYPKSGGCTPLMRAIRAGNMQAFRILLKAGALINKRGSWDFPIHVAVDEDSVAFVKACIAAGASLNRRDCGGNTPLMMAARLGYVKVVRLLLKAGANPRLRDWIGQTACEIAADSHEAEIVRLLEAVSVGRKKR
jgi:uncharacterized protein